MSKRMKIIVLSVAAVLALLFVVMLFLALPIEGKGSVVPLLAFYVTGGATAFAFLAGAIFSFICRFRGLTRKANKVYDNTNTSDDDWK